MFLLKILTTFFLVIEASAKTQKSVEKPICDSKVVTRNCDFFKERSDQSVINLPDGSTISNPLYDPSKNKEPELTAEDYRIPFGGGIDYDKILFDQSEILDALADLPASTRFKLTFASFASTLAQNPNQNIELPWPPEDKNAKKQMVKRSELMAYLKEKMSTADYVRLKTLMQKQTTPLQAKMQEFARLQQKSIEEQKKQSEEKNLMYDKRNKKKNRFKELFLSAREDVEALIRRGKKDGELTAEEKILINKVRTIEWRDPDSPEVSNSTSCPGNAANAFYDPLSHTINVCPGQLFKSEAETMLFIAHEIGHAIDPCISRMDLWEVNQEKLKQLLHDSTLNPEFKTLLQDFMQEKITMVNFEPDLFISDLGNSKKLVESGILKKVEEGIEGQNYPFAKEYGCLVDRELIRENTPEDVATFIKYHERFLGKTTKGSTFQKTLTRYNKALDKYPQCFKTLAPASQMSETISDMIGAVISEKYILENPFKNEAEKVGALSFAHTACRLNNSSPPESYAPELAEDGLSGKNADPHLGNSERLEKIILNLPGMAKIYDCRRRVPGCFDHLSFSKRTNPAKRFDNGSDLKKGIK